MFKTEKFNQLPKQIIDKYNLKVGQTVAFKLLDSQKKPMGGKIDWPNDKVLPASGIFVDEDGKMYPIAPILPDGSLMPPTSRSFKRSNDGMIILRGGTVDAAVLYPYMMLLPDRKGGHEQSGVSTWYELYDSAEKAKRQSDTIKSKVEVLNKIFSLEPKKIIDVALSMGANIDLAMGDDEQANVAKHYLLTSAETAYDRVAKAISDEMTPYIALVKKMDSSGVIYYDPAATAVRWSDNNSEIVVATSEKWRIRLAEKIKSDKELQKLIKKIMG